MTWSILRRKKKNHCISFLSLNRKRSKKALVFLVFSTSLQIYSLYRATSQYSAVLNEPPATVFCDPVTMCPWKERNPKQSILHLSRSLRSLQSDIMHYGRTNLAQRQTLWVKTKPWKDASSERLSGRKECWCQTKKRGKTEWSEQMRKDVSRLTVMDADEQWGKFGSVFLQERRLSRQSPPVWTLK